MESNGLEAADWTRRALDGDHEAFGRLMQTFQPQILAMACRILGNRSDAEDVLQDSFVAIYRHRSTFKGQSRLSTWMYAIALNRIRNRLRRDRVLKWTSLDVCVPYEEGEGPLELPDEEDPPEVLVGRKLSLEAIEREASALSPDCRDMFRMRYFHDMPLSEIARRLGRPLGTVKVYLHRSRKRLQERLGEPEDGAEAPGR